MEDEAFVEGAYGWVGCEFGFVLCAGLEEGWMHTT